MFSCYFGRTGERHRLRRFKQIKTLVSRAAVLSASLFKCAVSIGRRNCSTNEAKNKLFSGVSKVGIGRATALLMPFSQLQSNPEPFKSNRENLKKQLKPSIGVNRVARRSHQFPLALLHRQPSPLGNFNCLLRESPFGTYHPTCKVQP